MQKVTCYKADDGTIFETEVEALLHDTKCLINQHIQKDEAYCYGKVEIGDADDLIGFVNRNSKLITMILEHLRQG